MSVVKLIQIVLASPLMLFAATPATGAPDAMTPTASYVVTVAQPQTHVFAVEMEISGTGSRELDVSMPVWTPGSYLVREYERHVITFAASDELGQPLDWRKVDKNTWRIDAGAAEKVIVAYEVYGREPSIRWSFVNDEGGHILGPNLFMYVVGAAELPVSARFELPEGWRVDGGIAPSADDPYLISARSYHELIDTPMLIGNFTDISFEVEGVPHLIAILGPNNADLERLSEDFAEIIKVCSSLFDGLPYERYAFVFLTQARGGGLEHANGTTIGLGSIDFSDPGSYRSVLGVTAHEFFHAWNVKRIQPPAFRSYNYEQENYTDALWFYEGFTSFYGDRILYRAGLSDRLDDPVSLVVQYRSTPGYAIQSAADASYNAWIQFYRRDESSRNYQTDYYFKGRLIANLLTLEIANRTAGAKSLDDVMRLMWERARDEGAAFDADDIRAVCEEVAGGSFKTFFDRYVFGAGAIPFEEYFELAGYHLAIDEKATRERDRFGYLGIYIGESNGRVRIDGVVRGTPAWRDGLNYGDEILAVDGVQVTGASSLLQSLTRYHPGQEVEFLVSRYGEPQTIPVTLGTQSTPIYDLTEVPDPTQAQLAVRLRWREGSP